VHKESVRKVIVGGKKWIIKRGFRIQILVCQAECSLVSFEQYYALTRCAFLQDEADGVVVEARIVLKACYEQQVCVSTILELHDYT
jgi:hypothetical protein